MNMTDNSPLTDRDVSLPREPAELAGFLLSRVPYGNIYPPAGLQACGYCDGNLRGYRGREVQGGPIEGNPQANRPVGQDGTQ